MKAVSVTDIESGVRQAVSLSNDHHGCILINGDRPHEVCGRNRLGTLLYIIVVKTRLGFFILGLSRSFFDPLVRWSPDPPRKVSR